MKQLTFITGNPKKAEQVSLLLEYPLKHQALDLDEIQHTDVEVVARDKALRAYKLLKTPVLVEDTSLSFTALNNLPGPFIKWFLEGLGIEGLCKLISPGANRSATATTCFALQDETGLYTFTGTFPGHISDTPQGKTDFGWNNIFIPEGETRTWAEMKNGQVSADTMRRRAVAKLHEHITKFYV